MAFLQTLLGPDLVTAISPPAGEWVLISEYDTPTKAILNDAETGKTITITVSSDPNKNFDIVEEDRFTSLEVVYYPQQQYTFPLVFTELFRNKKSAEGSVYSSGPNKGQKKYTSDDLETWKYSSMTIGTRNDKEVKTIRRLEIHPVAIEFLCKDGGSYVIIVQVSTKVLNPIPALQVKNFLLVVLGLIIEAIGNWGRRMTFAAARNINTDDRLQIKIGDEFYLDVINRTLGKIGLEVSDVSTIAHFAADISSELITSEEGIIEAENLSKAAIHDVNRRTMLNNAKVLENTTELTFQTGLAKAIENLLVKLQEEKTKTAGAYTKVGSKVQYLSIGNEGKGTDPLELLALLKKGGTNAT